MGISGPLGSIRSNGAPIPGANLARPRLGPRMGLGVRLPDVVGGDVRVDLRRSEVGMSKHRLDGAEVGAATKQVRGERVPQLVWRGQGIDARTGGVAPDDFPKTLARKPLAARRDEQRRLVSRRSVEKARTNARDVSRQVIQSHFSDGHEAPLAPLTEDGHEPTLEIQPGDADGAELRYPEAR